MSQRLGRARRLRKRREFLSAQRRGRPGRARHFLVLVSIADPPGGPARLGIVASRKVGNAVARNRGKRLVREWFRRRIVPEGTDVVVILHTGAASLTLDAAFGELDAALRQALARTGAATRRQRPRRAHTPR
jgi:ribonuclease P protein component